MYVNTSALSEVYIRIYRHLLRTRGFSKLRTYTSVFKRVCTTFFIPFYPFFLCIPSQYIFCAMFISKLSQKLKTSVAKFQVAMVRSFLYCFLRTDTKSDISKTETETTSLDSGSTKPEEFVEKLVSNADSKKDFDPPTMWNGTLSSSNSSESVKLGRVESLVQFFERMDHWSDGGMSVRAPSFACDDVGYSGKMVLCEQESNMMVPLIPKHEMVPDRQRLPRRTRKMVYIERVQRVAERTLVY